MLNRIGVLDLDIPIPPPRPPPRNEGCGALVCTADDGGEGVLGGQGEPLVHAPGEQEEVQDLREGGEACRRCGGRNGEFFTDTPNRYDEIGTIDTIIGLWVLMPTKFPWECPLLLVGKPQAILEWFPPPNFSSTPTLGPGSRKSLGGV